MREFCVNELCTILHGTTVGINRPGVRGLHITPGLYTTTEELDALVSAIKELSS